MKRCALAIGLLLLAACRKDEAPPEANVAQPAVPRPIEPGLYRQATSLLELKDPTLSAEQAAAAAKAVGSTQTADRCVTPEMIANPKAIAMSSVDEGCTIQRSLWEGGKIDIALTCPESEDSSAGTMQLTGTYDAYRYAIAMLMNGQQGEVMRMKVDAKRLGDCPK